MASTLFDREAYRAAFFFDLEEGFDFVVDVVEAPWLDFRGEEEAVRVVLLREVLLRVRVRGASFTGSATVSVRPVFTALEER